MIKQAPPLFEHQKTTVEFILDRDSVFILNDPGTGKTRTVLEAFARYKTLKPSAKLCVLAPLSILEPSWGGDIKKFTPEMQFCIAYAKNRTKAFASDADIYISNHEAVKYLEKDNPFGKDDWLVVDESTAFKNPTAKRSKALKKISSAYGKRILMTGTPVPNTVCDVWHQMLCVDGGERLGSSFWKFRSQVCIPKPVPGMPNVSTWEDKPGATDWVMDMIRDVSIRYKAEDCLDLPENRVQTMYVQLPRGIYNKYVQLARESVVQLETGTINAVHAGSRVKKLLQLCTGAVYDDSGEVKLAHTDRYDLVADLVEQRANPCVVAYNWKHERQQLQEICKKRGVSFAFIDGDVPASKRSAIVDQFQAGQIQMLACHPQAAGHGLTLTTGKTTIWCSPTYNSEHFQQLNRRIHRAGQTEKTETILIAAEMTAELDVYDKLQGKLGRMEDLLTLFEQSTKEAA
jgi:hypothetical protein